MLLLVALAACQNAGVVRPSPTSSQQPPSVNQKLALRLPPLEPPDPAAEVTFPLPPEWNLVSVEHAEERFFKLLVGSFEGRLTPRGEVAVPVRYHELYEYGRHSEGRHLISIQGRRWGPMQRYGGLKGIVSDRGRTILPNRYQSVDEPFEDRIQFMINGRFGYTDGLGRPAIPALFDGARQFADGLACVNVGGRQYQEDWIPDYVVGGKWGFIDRYGHWVVPPTLDGCTRYYGGLAAVQVGCVESTSDEFGRKCRGGTWGLLDVKGRWVQEPRLSSLKVTGEVVNRSNAPWEVPDVRNPEFIACRDCKAHPHPACSGKPGRICGRIGPGGKWLDPFRRDYPAQWDQSRSLLRNRRVEETNPPGPYTFGEDDYEHEGHCSRYGPPQLIVGPEDGACRRITKEKGAFTCTAKDGRKTRLTGVDAVEAFNGPLAPVRVRGRWGFINGEGRVVVAPTLEAERVFARLCHLSLERDDRGRLLFFRQTAGQQGMLSATGVLRPERPGVRGPSPKERVPSFEDRVSSHGRYELVRDRTDWRDDGWRWEPSWERIKKRYQAVDDVGQGRSRVKAGGRYGLMDETGRLLLPVVHRELRGLNRTLFGVCRGDSGDCRDPGAAGWRLRRLDTLEELPGAFTDLRPAEGGFILFAETCRKTAGAPCPRRFGVMDPDGVIVLRHALDLPPDADPEEEHEFVYPRTPPAPFTELLGQRGPFAVAGAGCSSAKDGPSCDRTGIVAFTGEVVFGPQAQRIVTDELWDEYGSALYCRRGGPVDRGTVRVADDRGRHGLMSLDGRVLIPPRYDLVCTPDRGVARVMVIDDLHPNRAFGAWGLVAEGGQEVLPPDFGYISSFQQGVARVNEGGFCYIASSSLWCRGGVWGLVDHTGRFVVSPRFDVLGPFRGDTAPAHVFPRFSLLPVAAPE